MVAESLSTMSEKVASSSNKDKGDPPQVAWRDNKIGAAASGHCAGNKNHSIEQDAHDNEDSSDGENSTSHRAAFASQYLESSPSANTRSKHKSLKKATIAKKNKWGG